MPHHTSNSPLLYGYAAYISHVDTGSYILVSGEITMDLMDKLASLAERHEELNTLMAQPEVLADISLLQRYGREHSELEEVVQKYNELIATNKQIAEAQDMYDSEEGEMRDLAFEELERLKKWKEQLLEEVKIALVPRDIMDEKNAIMTIQGGAGGDEA